MFHEDHRAESRSQEPPTTQQPRKHSTQPLQRPHRPGHEAAASPGASGPPARRGCSPLADARAPFAPRSRAAHAYPNAPKSTRSGSETAEGQRRRASSGERGLCSEATRRADGRTGPGGSAPRGAARAAVTQAAFGVSRSAAAGGA